jgi:hypothetical protein
VEVKPKDHAIDHTRLSHCELHVELLWLEVSHGVWCVEVKGEHWLGVCQWVPGGVLRQQVHSLVAVSPGEGVEAAGIKAAKAANVLVLHRLAVHLQVGPGM